MENRGNRGFTMIEMLVASALMALLCGLVFPIFIATARVFEGTLATMELTMQGRALREKLLYRVNGEDGIGGLSNLSFSNSVLYATASKSIRIQPAQAAASASPAVVAVRVDEGTLSATDAAPNWLNSRGAKLMNDYIFQFVSNSFVRVNLNLELENGGRTYTKSEIVDAQVVNP